jgi:hypothetical protein
MQTIGRTILMAAALAVVAVPCRGDGPGRIYTKPADADAASLSGKVDGAKLTHAIAVERDRKRVYLAELDAGKTGFRFPRLPVGKFDLVLVTEDGRLAEGLALGDDPPPEDESASNATKRVLQADSFFNRQQAHRAGRDGERLLILVERIRDRQVLRGSGEGLGAYLRRLEIIELQQATDDWQQVGTRHIFREEIPEQPNPPFLKHLHLPELGNVRMVDSPRELAIIHLNPQ